MRLMICMGLVSLWGALNVGDAQETSAEPNTIAQEISQFMPQKLPKLQIDVKTMGGRQFWGDVCFFQGYRIQQNVLTEHYRLLDPIDVRRAWGTREECEAELKQIRQEKGLKSMSGPAVVLIHGIIRSSKSFSKMAAQLREDGYTVIGFDYPSTRRTMAESADFLRQTLASLEGVDQIDLVCHSMGGLLVRSYLQQMGEKRDPRLHRVVMLGTPNRGAEMADLLKKNLAFQWVFGPAGQELVKDPAGTIASLPIPDLEFGLIAGARGTQDGWNPLVPGDDDGTVSVSSTQLPGASDFIEVRALHSFLPEDKQAIQATRHFVKTGCFRESGIRCPISRD